MLYVKINPSKSGGWNGIILGIFSPNFTNTDINNLMKEITEYIDLNCKTVPNDVKVEHDEQLLAFVSTVNSIKVHFILHDQII